MNEIPKISIVFICLNLYSAPFIYLPGIMLEHQGVVSKEALAKLKPCSVTWHLFHWLFQRFEHERVILFIAHYLSEYLNEHGTYFFRFHKYPFVFTCLKTKGFFVPFPGYVWT